MLEEIGAGDVPRLIVHNKIDRIPGREPGVERDEYGKITGLRLSALDGSGLDLLRMALLELRPADSPEREVGACDMAQSLDSAPAPSPCSALRGPPRS